jgi:tRNA(Ile2)-agmatinylcytidine synthase
METLHVGFDDTDSPRGGCTTYIAALLVEKLENLGVVFIDYPNLIRLNPNVPWKTRGNGALCLRIRCRKHIIPTVFETVADTVEDNADLSFKDTDPGIVVFHGAQVPRSIRIFAKNTIQGVVTLDQALALVKRFKAEALGFGTGYGIVGALAAIGETLEKDHTYEVIAYRTPPNRGRKRQVDTESIMQMDLRTTPLTFNNLDPQSRRVLITPRGPDPILYGVRGETPEAVIQAHSMIRALEPVERWVVFRTNQGTDSHLRHVEAISQIQPYHPVAVRGQVASAPRLIPRRHRVFSIEDATGEVDCAAYEPTGALRKIAGQLIMGDQVQVYGGVKPSTERHPLTVNLEKLEIVKLESRLVYRNPACPRCGKRVSSMGRAQGFRCRRCGYESAEKKKTAVQESRDLTEGLYVTSLRSQRHLTRPISRYGKDNTGQPVKMVSAWHWSQSTPPSR